MDAELREPDATRLVGALDEFLFQQLRNLFFGDARYGGDDLKVPEARINFDGVHGIVSLVQRNKRTIFGGVNTPWVPHEFNHLPRRITPKKPIAAAAMPPMSIQTAWSVGEPVKKRETSELNDFVAFAPITMSTMPPASRAMETALFVAGFPRAIHLPLTRAFVLK
jgi:hypothetical protein